MIMSQHLQVSRVVLKVTLHERGREGGREGEGRQRSIEEGRRERGGAGGGTMRGIEGRWRGRGKMGGREKQSEKGREGGGTVEIEGGGEEQDRREGVGERMMEEQNWE